MGRYVVSTAKEQQEMLESLGFKSFDDLYQQVPKDIYLGGKLDLPEGLSEIEVAAKMEELADKNVVFKEIYRGAGAYNHYVPAAVSRIVSKEEFLTAYTPYQAEISQGILQSIFEYQTMMCQLTGLDVSNASVYDGATAAAEAAVMCVDRKRKKVLISGTTNPEVIEVVQTYCYGKNLPLEIVPAKDGVTDMDALKEALTDDVACFYVQQPNFFGIVEDYDAIGVAVHENKSKFIMGSNPMALAILKTPAEYDADIAVGDGQPLGMSLSFGGPYVGFMTAKESLMRSMPGRIVGQTTDDDGNRAFVLTLQAREQHIRRDKASSNICSNQALCALTANVYLSVMGPEGFKSAASNSASLAHYMQGELAKIGLAPKYAGEFFNEFVTVCPDGVDAEAILTALENKGILGGLSLGDGEILWCTTEKNTKAGIDKLVEIIKEVC